MEIRTLPNLGFIIDKVPNQILEDLSSQVDSIVKNLDTKDTQGTYLYHNFKNVYKLQIKQELETYLLELCNTYVQNFDTFEDLSIFDSQNIEIYLDELWVNLQEQGQFNPNHKHAGIFSFAIYLKIPYFNDRQNPNQKGNFEFTYTNTVGNLSNYVVQTDKKIEGSILFFPSKMQHCVYPFYENNQLRITISGNIKPRLEK